MTNAEVQREVLKGNRHKKPVQCPNELYKIMNDCWHKEPEQRPTFETLKYTMEDFAVATEGPYQNIVEWPSDLDLVHIQTE